MSSRDSLARYRQKRDFHKTPEPAGTEKESGGGSRYLIQKHAATRLHYDFRLELDGVLKSWAVTRGPSLDPHDRRLAVEVEDHPVSYGSFEGIIPQGQYGGGTVMLWDEGEWEPLGDPRQGLAKGKLEFNLKGERLKGGWTLVRMRDRDKDKGRHNWLLIKRSDPFARAGDNDRLLNDNATSVVSGRTMEGIASSQDRVWQSQEKKSANPTPTKTSPKSTLPSFTPPQLATLADAIPRGQDWVHEIKFDGYRALAYLDNKTVRIFTRTGLDWTHRFSTIASVLSRMKVKTAILDGEIVALDDREVTSFKTLQNKLSEKDDRDLQYYVFDLLFLNGTDLTKEPLLARKQKLKQLLEKSQLSGRVFYSEHFAADNDLLERLCRRHFEGLISKNSRAPYTSGRGTAWLKIKCHLSQEFVIGGFTLPKRGQRGIGSLLIGYYDKEQLVYSGKVGTGFDHDTSMDLRKRLDALARDTCPFAAVPAAVARTAKWVKPRLVCNVEFAEWTADQRLRHPSFQGLREDKPVESITRDAPLQAPAKESASPRAKKAMAAPKTTEPSPGKDPVVDGVRISHPERIIYPGTSITKLQLAEYYSAVADFLLPHLENRPLSMIRCPEGIGKECFFQRHVARGQSPHVHEAVVMVKGRQEKYLAIVDRQGLISLVQWGVIELHPWGCLTDRPELPDRIIFDLDPDPDLPWQRVTEAASEIRLRMQEFKLESFVKTTGGKGLHVVVPLARSLEWKPVKAFAHAIADSMQHDHPKLYIAKSSKAARQGKIYVDYLRNDLTSTSVAAYSARARAGATVSMPIRWEQLETVEPQSFTVETVPGLLKKRRVDPWKNLLTTHQEISKDYLRALKIE